MVDRVIEDNEHPLHLNKIKRHETLNDILLGRNDMSGEGAT